MGQWLLFLVSFAHCIALSQLLRRFSVRCWWNYFSLFLNFSSPFVFFLGFTSCSTADCRHSVRSFCSLIVRWFSCHPLTCVSLCELLGVWWIIGDDDENKSESKIVNGKIISSSRIIYLISHFGLNALLRALADVFMDSSWRINLFMKLKYNNIMHISMLGKCCLRCESKIVEWNKRPAWRT